jgi:biotin transport system substrate-specific component
MENALKLLKSQINLRFICLAIFGSMLLTLGALVKIPFYPVPFTLQSFAIFILGLTQNPKLSTGSAICYLLWGSIGLPVFPSGVNPWWIAGPCGGYLLAFPIAAFMIAKLKEFTHPLVAALSGQAVIYFLGFVWLIPFLGIEDAWVKGVLFFIPSGLLKVLVAVKTADRWNQWSQS